MYRIDAILKKTSGKLHEISGNSALSYTTSFSGNLTFPGHFLYEEINFLSSENSCRSKTGPYAIGVEA